MSSVAQGQSADPLNDRERRLLNRLLSDPQLYPQTFKSWLVPYLEGSDMDLAILNVHGLQAALDGKLNATTLSGTVLLFDGPDAPAGTEFHPDAAIQAAAPTGLKFIRVL